MLKNVEKKFEKSLKKLKVEKKFKKVPEYVVQI